MENPIKMDDLEVPLFSETPIWINEYNEMSTGLFLGLLTWTVFFMFGALFKAI